MKDKAIIELYWQRDEEAIEQTKAQYGSYCYSIAENILHSHEDSEECVSDTYLRAWNAMPPQWPEKLKLFLGRITRNLAIDRYKHNRAAKRNSGETELILDELSECISSGENVESTMETKEIAAIISAFLRTLPQRDRTVFVRRYFFAESAEVIGKRFTLSPGNVGVILSRVRTKLRKHLEKEGYVL